MSRLVAQWPTAGLGMVDMALASEGYAYRDTPRTGIRPLPAHELASALELAPAGMGGVHVFDSEDAVEAAGMRLSGDAPSHYAVQVLQVDGDATVTLARFVDEASAHAVVALLSSLSAAQEAVADAQDAVVEAIRYGGHVALGCKTSEQRIELASRRVKAWQRLVCGPLEAHESAWCITLSQPSSVADDLVLLPLTQGDGRVVERMVEYTRLLADQLDGVRSAQRERSPSAMAVRVEPLDLDRLMPPVAWQCKEELEFDDQMGAMKP